MMIITVTVAIISIFIRVEDKDNKSKSEQSGLKQFSSSMISLALRTSVNGLTSRVVLVSDRHFDKVVEAGFVELGLAFATAQT